MAIQFANIEIAKKDLQLYYNSKYIKISEKKALRIIIALFA